MSSVNQTLDISNVINVTVLPAPAGLQPVNINTIGVFTRAAKPGTWAEGQDYGLYKTLGAVGTDWGLNSDAYAIAQGIFAQVPNPIGAGGYVVIVPRTPGETQETVRAAITRVMGQVYFYGVLIDEEMDAQSAEFAALAAQCKADGKMFFYCSSNIAMLEPGSMLDLLRSGSVTRARAFYHGNALLNGATAQQTQIFAGAYAGRALSVNFSGSLTATTLHLKALVGINPDQTISQTELAKAQAAGVDVYVAIAGLPCLFTSGENSYFDDVYNADWMAFALQVAGFNYLKQTNYKIPQTETGMTGLKDAYGKVCRQAVTNGVLGPGAWTSPDTVGNQADCIRNVADVGYYVYSLPVNQQLQADRQARKAPVVQIAAKFAGAIHESDVVVNLNA